MTKLLKKKDALQRELGNNYGALAVPLGNCIVEIS